MLVLFETPGGYAIFKVLDEDKLQEADNIWKEFESPEKASEVLKLVSFKAFKDTTEALQATNSLLEGKISKSLKKMLKKCVASDAHEKLAVADAKLGAVIKEKFSISCIHNTAIAELMRGIRSQMESLISELPRKDMAAMALGLAHSLSRYKLKFSPEKVDTMIVQAVSLLDDLDKELNNYIMRCREWYGWHFPEVGKIIQDHQAYAKVVKLVGVRQNVKSTDLSDILPEDLEEKVKEAAEISMGTEISELDIMNIRQLCDQVIEINSYRTELYEYLKNRMMALAPNLTILLGELVGARLISHAGSLMSLAKYPASTVQILGAEKALFRALKTKKDTPKYGLLYHAQLVGQAPGKLKGKMSRMLAAKSALACRVDALGEDNSTELGVEHRAYLENRMKVLQEQGTKRISGTGRQKAKFESYNFKSDVLPYDSTGDSTIPSAKKRRFDGSGDATEENQWKGDGQDEQKSPKKKKIKLEQTGDEEQEEAQPELTSNGDAEEEEASAKKKKKKKSKMKEEITE